MDKGLINSIITLLLMMLLTGCAVNSGVIQMGNNTYMVSRQAATGFYGMGTLKADAMREAYDVCKKQGKVVEVIEVIDAKPPYIFTNFPRTEVRFRCVNDSPANDTPPTSTPLTIPTSIVTSTPKIQVPDLDMNSIQTKNKNPNAFAVVIGNKDYQSTQKVSFAILL